MRTKLKQLLMTAAVSTFATEAFAQTFTATADATINYKSSSKDYGSSQTLEVDSSPRKYALIKFSVSGISGSIQSAKVRLFATDSSSSGPEIYQASNSWIENTVTYSNKPALLSSKLDDRGSISAGNYVEYNVSAVVKSNGEFSFLLKPDSSDGADFSSRESSRPPVLVISVATASLTPAPSPSPSPSPSPTPIATPTPSPSPTPISSYTDDTFSALTSGVTTKIVSGGYGYNSYTHSQSADGKALAIDMREASFVVAISKNSNPTTSYDCNYGSLPTNRYPITVKYDDQVSLVGAYVEGEIPQDSDWRATYCNSAVISFRDGTIDPAVDGFRVTSAWDGVRLASGGSNLKVQNSWFSGVRDDVIENDYRQNLQFIDNLADGVFQAISVRPSSTSTVPDSSANTVLVSGSVIRLPAFLYEGEMAIGSLFKTSSTGAPKNKIYNTVVALDPGSAGILSSGNYPSGWKDTIDCKNNLFLWMSDRALPSELGTIPSCFTVIRGQAAIEAWNKAKTNWINCHPKVRRSSTDPASDFSQCRANDFGGYTN